HAQREQLGIGAFLPRRAEVGGGILLCERHRVSFSPLLVIDPGNCAGSYRCAGASPVRNSNFFRGGDALSTARTEREQIVFQNSPPSTARCCGCPVSKV